MILFSPGNSEDRLVCGSMVGENITTNLLVVGQVNTPSNSEQSCVATALFFFIFFYLIIRQNLYTIL